MATRRTLSVGLSASTGDIGVTALCMPARVLTSTGMIGAVLIRQPAARADTALVIGCRYRAAAPVGMPCATSGSVLGAGTRHNAVVDTSPRAGVGIPTLNRGCRCCGAATCATPIIATTVIAPTGVATTVIATPGATTSAETPQMPTGPRRRAGTLKTTTTVIAEIKGTEGAARLRGLRCADSPIRTLRRQRKTRRSVRRFLTSLPI